MEKRIVLRIVVIVMFLAALFLTFKVGSVSSGVETVQAATSVVKATASSSGMVGGC
jgi:FlaG/FlaF family flagellin (archaellin)